MEYWKKRRIGVNIWDSLNETFKSSFGHSIHCTGKTCLKRMSKRVYLNTKMIIWYQKEVVFMWFLYLYVFVIKCPKVTINCIRYEEKKQHNLYKWLVDKNRVTSKTMFLIHNEITNFLYCWNSSNTVILFPKHLLLFHLIIYVSTQTCFTCTMNKWKLISCNPNCVSLYEYVLSN